MLLKTVGIVSPGDMGHSVGQTLREHGLRVVTCLEGRSARTKMLAEAAQIEALPTYEALVQQAEVILSIVAPAGAESVAERVARAMEAEKAAPLYVDCNAIAPQTARAIAARITSVGARFVDASIIGGPPRGGYVPRIYASGEDAEVLVQFNAFGLHIIPIGERIGDASALKLCFASLTKGSAALYAQSMIAAQALGVAAPLREELQQSQSERLAQIMRGLPRLPVKARRFVGEMEEMSKMYTALGMSPNMLAGAAEVYRLIGRTPLADRTPEDTSPFPSLDDVLAVFVAYLNTTET